MSNRSLAGCSRLYPRSRPGFCGAEVSGNAAVTFKVITFLTFRSRKACRGFIAVHGRLRSTDSVAPWLPS